MPLSARNRHALAAWLALALAAIGCATLNEQECKAADWRAIGRADGERGYGMGRLDEHRKACAEHRITPNADRYWLGRSEGLVFYCTTDNALRAGRAGQGYEGVCPPAIDPAFRLFHSAGRDAWRTRTAMDSIDQDIDRLEGLLRQQGLSDRERGRLRQTIREQDRRRDRLRDELQDQEQRIDRLLQDRRQGLLPR